MRQPLRGYYADSHRCVVLAGKSYALCYKEYVKPGESGVYRWYQEGARALDAEQRDDLIDRLGNGFVVLVTEGVRNAQDGQLCPIKLHAKNFQIEFAILDMGRPVKIALRPVFRTAEESRRYLRMMERGRR